MSQFVSGILEVFRNGYINSCPVPSQDARCNCEYVVLLIVACLALITGSLQFFVGYFYSMAVMEDSVHALGDASGDLFGAFIAYKILLDPTVEKRYNLISNKGISTLMLVGGALVAYEALDRFVEGIYIVSPLAAFVSGSIGYRIDTFRKGILLKAKSHYPNDRIGGYIDHAETDARISLSVAFVGGVTFLISFLPIDRTYYQSCIRILDFVVAMYLMMYIFKIARNRWYGKGCSHVHGPKCDPNH